MKAKKIKAKTRNKKSKKRQIRQVSIKPVILKTETVLDQVRSQFIEKVLQKPQGSKINKQARFEDFYSDKRFAKEFKEMFLLRVKMIFGVSIASIYDQPLSVVIQFLRDLKIKKLYYNWQ